MYLKREKGVYVFILNNRGIVVNGGCLSLDWQTGDSLGKEDK